MVTQPPLVQWVLDPAREVRLGRISPHHPWIDTAQKMARDGQASADAAVFASMRWGGAPRAKAAIAYGRLMHGAARQLAHEVRVARVKLPMVITGDGVVRDRGV